MHDNKMIKLLYINTQNLLFDGSAMTKIDKNAKYFISDVFQSIQSVSKILHVTGLVC